MAHNQIYGVFLQIKDTLEIILKLMVLTVVSELLEQKNVPDDNNDIAFKLFEKPLSLGDWETICFGLKNKSQYSELNILTDAICVNVNHKLHKNFKVKVHIIYNLFAEESLSSKAS